MILHGTSRINEKGNLEIGGCDTVELARIYGTPLYIMDEAHIRQKIREWHQAFRDTGLAYQVAYASKAFMTMAMCRIAEEENCLLDVVSDGELYTALKAGFPTERIYFHGNNKSPFELELALDTDVGYFIADNFVELAMLQQLAAEKRKTANVILRITPGVEAHTHEYILTGQEDSKFGFDLGSGQAQQAVEIVLESPNLRFQGFHCHIGSQIFEMESFVLTVEKMAGLIRTCNEKYGLSTPIFNIGGGFAIRYTEEDPETPVTTYVRTIAEALKQVDLGQPDLPEIWVEPGRQIVGEAGTTIYTIGTMKEVPGIRKYISVDGGMADNPRVALYQAKYGCLLANRANEPASEVVTVAGKCCESGDILIWDAKLPKVRTGDLLAMNCTGAYQYTMSSNYNRLRRPAVVFVYNGQADVVVERETLDDLLYKERIPERLQKQPVPISK